MPFSKLKFSDHAIQRMFERRVSVREIRGVLELGELIEEYPDDVPFPSRLVVGWQEGRCLHVIAADDQESRSTVVITVYEPDPNQWEQPDYRRRRARA